MDDEFVAGIKEHFNDMSLRSYNDVELLHFLLSFSGQRKDLRTTAQALIDRFGSLSEVLDAHPEDLMKVGDVNRNTAVLLTMLPSVWMRVKVDSALQHKIQGREAVRDFAANCYIDRTMEVFMVVCLDKHDTMIRYELFPEGAVDWANVDIRRLVSLLLRTSADSLIVCHNHPRGFAKPSMADCRVTQTITNTVVPIGFRFLDHIIYSNRGYFSMAEHPKEYGHLFIPEPD